MTEKVCVNCFVSGKVQGVWFRASTQKEAEKIGVTGWVRNLADGRVEVMACGSREQIETLKAWLKHGPQHAIVEDLVCIEIPWREYEGFDVI